MAWQKPSFQLGTFSPYGFRGISPLSPQPESGWYVSTQPCYYHERTGVYVRRLPAPPGGRHASAWSNPYVCKSFPKDFALRHVPELQGEIWVHEVIQDPCMAALRDVRVTDGWLHLVFDDAGRRLRYKEPKSFPPNAREVSRNVTLATAAAQTLVRLLIKVHRLGLRFSDLKPDQLVGKMADDGTFLVSLVDWGSIMPVSEITKGHTPCFTRRYAPPEALRCHFGRTNNRIPAAIFATDAFDVWGLGITICEIALGTFPFFPPYGGGAASDASLSNYENRWAQAAVGYEADVAREMVTRPFAFTSATMWPHLPAQQLIMACLQPDPRLRIRLEDIPSMPWAAALGIEAIPLPAPELPIGSAQATAPAAEEQPRRQEEVGVQVQLGDEAAEECAALKGQLAAEAQRADRAEAACVALKARFAAETAARSDMAKAERAALELQLANERAWNEAACVALKASLAAKTAARSDRAEAERAALKAQLAEEKAAAAEAQASETAAALQRAQALVQELQHKLNSQRASMQAAVVLTCKAAPAPSSPSEEGEEEVEDSQGADFVPLSLSVDGSESSVSGGRTPISSSGPADAFVQVLIEPFSERPSPEAAAVCGGSKQQQGLTDESLAAAGGEEVAHIICASSSSDSVSGSSEDGASSSGAEEIAQYVVHSLSRRSSSSSSMAGFEASREQQQTGRQQEREQLRVEQQHTEQQQTGQQQQTGEQQHQGKEEQQQEEQQPKAAVQKDERTLKQRFAGAVHKAAKMLGFVKGPKRQ